MRYPLITHYLCLPCWPGLGQPAKGLGRVLVSCPVPPFRGQDKEAQAWLRTPWTTPKKREKTTWLPPKESLRLPGTDHSISFAERFRERKRNKLKVATFPRRLMTRGTNLLSTRCLCSSEDPGTLDRKMGCWLAGYHRTAVCSAAGLECRAKNPSDKSLHLMELRLHAGFFWNV